MCTHRFIGCLSSSRFEMGGILHLVRHVGPTGTHVWVYKSTVFEFEFEAPIRSYE